MFTLIPPSHTGVYFVNKIHDTDKLSILNYIGFYNGSGVAVGDLNHDGLPDIFLTSNAHGNRLFLNEGHFKFKDITQQAGVKGTPGAWSTGVTMADVNGDGLLDIYVCRFNYRNKKGANELFINEGVGKDGIPHFKEEAAKYGLNFKGYSTQATFFDYNRDGHLDMYLTNYSILNKHSEGGIQLRSYHAPKAGDRLYENIHGHFVDITRKAGLYNSALGYGLATTISDINNDGWPDIYVSNDFKENDYLYYNNGNGTFRESVKSSLGHSSRSSMGNDIADINDDGRPDIVVADMLPRKEKILKQTAEPLQFNVSNYQHERLGFYYQYSRNTLQLNRGTLPSGTTLFSDIAPLAGLAATDWSWAPLLCDLDNDGWKDLFITNGIYGRPNNLNYLYHITRPRIVNELNHGLTRKDLQLLKYLPHGKISDFAFHNNGNLTFTNDTKKWGLDLPSYSNGAAYVDLNDDGALDLVINQVNGPVLIYRNNAQSLNHNQFLRIKLRGNTPNTYGLGTKVYLYKNGKVYYRYETLTRGFESSVDPVMHFGLGKIKEVDSLRVIWPNWKTQKLIHVNTGQTLTLYQKNAHGYWNYRKKKRAVHPILKNITSHSGVSFKHRGNPKVAYYQQPLIPHLLSAEGPKIAVADVNGDGLEDFYIGGGKGQAGRLYIQKKNGTFVKAKTTVFNQDKNSDDTGVLFFDANGDGYPDLYVVSGDDAYPGHAEPMRDRLYLNDGHGHFIKTRGYLPPMYEDGSCVAAADFNHDGHEDLFVGGRDVYGRYGISPRSYLLENEGDGHFKDVTSKMAHGLSKIGMVSDAVWCDYDHDGWPDLILTGEWMPITIFHNDHGHLVNVTQKAGLSHTNGWWNTIKVADINDDGRPDFVVGNLGLNSVLHASRKSPLLLYLNDFDHNGITDPVIAYRQHNKYYPLATYKQFISQFYSLKAKYPNSIAFAGKTIHQLFSDKALDESTIKKAYTFASCYLENMGNGRFTVHKLPIKAQLAPVYSILVKDFNGDGRKDLLLAGDLFGVRNAQGRYDAGYGTLLEQSRNGNFKNVPLLKGGFIIRNQVRDLKLIKDANSSQLILTSVNNDSLKVFKIAHKRR